MRILTLEGPPSEDLSARLTELEEEFTYPLGSGQSFRISHGKDYTRFFRSMGRAACFLAFDGPEIVGVMACVIRRLGLPDGSEIEAAYMADLKIRPSARSGRALLDLARAAQAWVSPVTRTAFGVVMEGTTMTPDRYSGRAGLPLFSEAARIEVLQISTAATSAETTPNGIPDQESGERAYRALTIGRIRPVGGDPSLRSEHVPQWLGHKDGDACGRLEDTRSAKRLIAPYGREILCAHLSCFGFRTPQAGAQLLLEACGLAARRGFSGLFTAVSDREGPALRAALEPMEVTVAPARVYASGMKAGALWAVNTSEI